MQIIAHSPKQDGDSHREILSLSKDLIIIILMILFGCIRAFTDGAQDGPPRACNEASPRVFQSFSVAGEDRT
jgi:hypothetical protein